ncbi:MAG: A/G-specific adenine glycosylase [Methanolinea sp.]|nr:A/G-specific adenine glycosylase [Methanolinea sp.]
MAFPGRDGDALPGRQVVEEFREAVYGYYRRFGRRFPWRETRDPYAVLVSELMLQQTGVGRVSVYFPRFIGAFPGFPSLSRATLADVLREWKGLGYNRRARDLHRIAQVVTGEYDGNLPRDEAALAALPGIGRATAAAIAAFAFDKPSVFVETNIRRLFLYRFFPSREGVRDSEIVPLVAATLDRENPREWYYAMMDLGASLRCARPDPVRRSAHYRKQPPFRGSDRELRGKILSLLLSKGPVEESRLHAVVGAERGRVQAICDRLAGEGMVAREGGMILVPGTAHPQGAKKGRSYPRR